MALSALLSRLRSWALRHLARRFNIGEDVLEHLSTFQRFGERFEVEAPREMLPVGARTLLRAVRTRAAPQIRPDWLWPYWLERQLDPTSEAFTPRGHLAVMQNVTARNWTAVGNRWSPWEAIVDPTGLVTPWFDGWSLDWWVHDGGGWRFPSREPDVTQDLDGGAPVVRTRLAVASGEVVHRAYGHVTRDGGRDVEVAIVDVDNRTETPVDVALAVRPYNPEGLAVLSDIELTGTRVGVQRGALGLLLPRTPARTVMSTFSGGDVANHLRDGTGGSRRLAVHDPAGLAQAAFVFEVPAGKQLRAAMPLLPAQRQRRRSLPQDLGTAPARLGLAGPAEVADTWSGPLGRGLQVELPDGELQEAVTANRAYQLLLHDPGSITPGPFTYHRFWFRDAAYQLVALDRWGLHDEARDVLTSFPDRQRADGFFYSQWREWDANGAAIWAIAEHHRLTGDDALLRRLAPAVAKGARWIARTRGRHRSDDPAVQGLLPPGVSAEHLGPYDFYYWDDFWSLRGLRDAAYVARHVGDAAGVRRAEETARSLTTDLRRSIGLVAERLGRQLIPAGPRRGVDPGMIGSLVACEPLRLLDPEDPRVAGTAEVIRERFTLGDAFYQGISHTGLGTYLTLQLALVELERSDPRAWRRFRWLLDAATPTWTWPEAVHPRLDGGCMGDGHHGWASADALSFLRNVLVREGRDGSLVLLGMLPESWAGEPLTVTDAPTHHGPISYRLRWDGPRPVLRWRCRRPDVTVRAPALDPRWSTTDQAGEWTFDGPATTVPDRREVTPAAERS